MVNNQVCFGRFFCINTYVLVGLLLFVIGFLLYSKSTINNSVVKVVKVAQKDSPVDSQKKKFYERIYDVLAHPAKDYIPEYPKSNTELPTYQPLGFVFRTETDANYNPDDNNKFTLYGRPRHYGSSQFEYYVIADGIKMPLSNTKEIYDADVVSITGYTGDFIVSLYENEGVRYNPFLV